MWNINRAPQRRMRSLRLLLVVLAGLWQNELSAATITDVQLHVVGVDPEQPVNILCGSSQTFTINVFGTSSPGDVVTLTTRVWDQDFPQNTMLDLFNTNPFTVTTSVWFATLTFTLRCTDYPDCKLVGALASSDESSTNVFVNLMGGGTTVGNVDSNVLDVECAPVPEPASIILTGVGLASLIVTRGIRTGRHRAKL